MDIKEAIESLGGKCSKCSESKEQLLRFHFKGNAPNIIYFFSDHVNSATEQEVKEKLSKCELFCLECIRDLKVRKNLK